MEKDKPLWKNLALSESYKGFWELFHNTEDKIIKLSYVPEVAYSDKDIHITLNYDEFKDLIQWLNRISKTAE